MIYNNLKILYPVVVLLFFVQFSTGLKAQAPGGTSLEVELWLSADQVQGAVLPSNGVDIDSWIDRSAHERNFGQNKENNADYNTLPRFKYEGMNYHPAVEFYTTTESNRRNRSRKLISEENIPFKRYDGKAYYTFWVSRLAPGSTNYSTVLAFNESSDDYYGWYKTNQIWHKVRSTNYANDGNVNKGYGLGIVYRQNGEESSVRVQVQYQDGVSYSKSLNSSYLSNGGNKPGVIGNSDLRDSNYFFGEIQEIIVLSSSGNSPIDLVELNKVQSYLAIKYGISIGSDFNYVNSDGVVIWDKTLNTGFNNDVLGIGRDDATGLYQKQSTSADDSQLKMYLGDQLYTLNSENNSELGDKDYLFLGSNRGKQFVSYKYQPGNVFMGGDLPGNTLDREINLRKELTYRARTGASRRSFSDVKLIADAMYILVSANPDFPRDETRIYNVDPVTSIASVQIDDEDYISFAIFEGVPGGLKSNLELWLSANQLLGKSEDLPEDEEDVTAWNDLSDNGRNFSRNSSNSVPRFTYQGLNFNPALEFYQDLSTAEDVVNLTTADRQRKLVSNSAFPIDAGKSYYTFWVSEVDGELAGMTGNHAPGTTGDNRKGIVFTFDGASNDYDNQGWNITRTASNPPAVTLTTSTGRNNYVNHPTGTGITAGIGAIIRPNAVKSPPLQESQYTNGIRYFYVAQTMESGSHTAVIGNAGTGTSGPFFGTIQEIIVYSGVAGEVMPDEDLKKIHTYLAVKYGVSLDNQDYITSKGIKIWDGTGNKNLGYEHHVFGLGRDNPSSLYVKQATSSSSPIFTAFVGELTDLNMNNTGFIADDTYAMFGSNGLSGLMGYEHKPEDNPPFTGTLDEKVNFRDNNVWKVQLTNIAVADMKISAPGKYILVSNTDPTFQPINTQIYKIDRELDYAEIPLRDGDYISFAYYVIGPGGVVNGLRMWLDAGDKDFINVTDEEVFQWSDKSQVSNTKYAYMAVNSANKVPGYDRASVHTNFYPAVNYRTQGEYLSTNKGPASMRSPQNYTVFHVVYNDFIKTDRSYFMGFGSKISNSTARRPVFGMRGYTSGVHGRFYEYGGTNGVEGTEYLFKPAATSINIQSIDRTAKTVRFESNGVYEQKSASASLGNGSRMSGVGVLGGGSRSNWQMQGVMAQSIFYERELDDVEKIKLYSYLGLKYAVTLRMPTAFDYEFSDGVSLWDGNAALYSTYHNNIGALVRDDTSDLFNNVARSTDGEATVTMMIRGHEGGINGQGDTSLLPENKSALIWGNNGNNNIYNFTAAQIEMLCGEMSSKTDKIWLVKKTDNLDKVDVSIRILQGDFGNYVSPGYQILLLVADDPDKLVNNNWDMAIPSVYLKDEQQQCINYTFYEEFTYFSLGIKALPGACETCDFEGTKQVMFTTQTWNPKGLKVNEFNLGNDGSGDDKDFTVEVKTNENQITWRNKYPRNSSQNSLKLARTRVATTEMITEITPSVAAATQFQIFNLDRESNRYKRVEIYGECESGVVIPKLSEVSSRGSSYSISGNIAQAKKSPTSTYANDRGKMNVLFDFPVEKIFVKEKAINGTNGSQTLGIGPIKFSCPAPIPTYSEAGLAFSKQATDTVLYCGQVSKVDYTFRIYSANCDHRDVSISDTLPEHLYWDTDLIYIPEIATGEDGYRLRLLDNNRILQIENMMVPANSTPFVFTAQARFVDSDIIVGKAYENQAWLKTSLIKNNVEVEIDPQPSADYYRGEGFKSSTYVKDGGARLSPVTVTAEKSRDCYIASGEITVTLQINNPNDQSITDMIFDVDYNEEFGYVNGSLQSSIEDMASNPSFESDDEGLVPGLFYLEKFTLPANKVSTITFKLRAPLKAALEGEVDENGNKLNWEGGLFSSGSNADDQAIVNLVIAYSFDTEMDADPDTHDICIPSSLIDAEGELTIPFCRSVEYIITNRMIQPRIR